MTPDTPSTLTRYHIEDHYYGEIKPGDKSFAPEDPLGSWVRYSDVAALEEENKRLREERDLLIRNWVPKNLWPLHLRSDLTPEVRAALSGESTNGE